MAIPATGARVTWDDIKAFCTYDPVTGFWSGDTPTIANYLNADYRHDSAMTVADVFDVCFQQLAVLLTDKGSGATPEDDSPVWRGLFDDYHRALPDAGQRNMLLKKAYNRILTRGQYSTGLINPVPDYPPQATQQDDRAQQAGLVLQEWNEVTQDLITDPAHDPLNDYHQDQTATKALWDSYTGGRRFGAVTDEIVQATIDTQNIDTARNSTFQVTQECRQRAQLAIDAVDASYRNNETDQQARAAYTGAWDGFDEPTLPYPPSE